VWIRSWWREKKAMVDPTAHSHSPPVACTAVVELAVFACSPQLQTWHI
jgi:hypothetical protein